LPVSIVADCIIDIWKETLGEDEQSLQAKVPAPKVTLKPGGVKSVLLRSLGQAQEIYLLQPLRPDLHIGDRGSTFRNMAPAAIYPHCTGEKSASLP
jgi:hypothetical protein